MFRKLFGGKNKFEKIADKLSEKDVDPNYLSDPEPGKERKDRFAKKADELLVEATDTQYFKDNPHKDSEKAIEKAIEESITGPDSIPTRVDMVVPPEVLAAQSDEIGDEAANDNADQDEILTETDMPIPAEIQRLAASKEAATTYTKPTAESRDSELWDPTGKSEAEMHAKLEALTKEGKALDPMSKALKAHLKEQLGIEHAPAQPPSPVKLNIQHGTAQVERDAKASQRSDTEPSIVIDPSIGDTPTLLGQPLPAAIEAIQDERSANATPAETAPVTTEDDGPPTVEMPVPPALLAEAKAEKAAEIARQEQAAREREAKEAAKAEREKQRQEDEADRKAHVEETKRAIARSREIKEAQAAVTRAATPKPPTPPRGYPVDRGIVNPQAAKEGTFKGKERAKRITNTIREYTNTNPPLESDTKQTILEHLAMLSGERDLIQQTKDRGILVQTLKKAEKKQNSLFTKVTNLFSKKRNTIATGEVMRLRRTLQKDQERIDSKIQEINAQYADEISVRGYKSVARQAGTLPPSSYARNKKAK